MIDVESDVLDFNELGLGRARLMLEGINEAGDTWKLEVGHLKIDRPEQIRFTVVSKIEPEFEIIDGGSGRIKSNHRRDFLKLIIDTVEMVPDPDLDGQSLKVTTSEELPDGQG